MILQFTIPGPPVPWARARQNGKRFFTDPKVAAFKELVALKAREAGARPQETPCTLAITAYLPIPASWSNLKKESARNGYVHPVSKPDWDNLGKGISDALNGIAYVDDSQIIYAAVRKVYDSNPRTEVTVQYL